MTAIWKISSKVPRAFTRWGQKTLFGTDLELCPKICQQQNMISAMGKKLVNLQELPYMPLIFDKLRSTNGWERLASFANPLQFAHRTSCRLAFVTHFGLILFTRCCLWSTQMPWAWLASVRLHAGRAHAGLCHAS